MKILFFGDIVGRLGRQAVAKVLPVWRKKYDPDLIIGNVENLAHGKGITRSTLQELVDLGFNAFTSGNHIWDKEEVFAIMAEQSFPVIRPANYPPKTPGVGSLTLTVGSKQVLVLNLMGQVNMPAGVENPFLSLDKELADPVVQSANYIVVDFHADVTSEKWALGWYADGRVNAVVGTHTHVPTADECQLTKGTLYQSDIGMTGGFETVLGVAKDVVVKKFLTGLPVKHDFPDHGEVWVNAAVLELNTDKNKQKITRLQERIIID